MKSVLGVWLPALVLLKKVLTEAFPIFVVATCGIASDRLVGYRV